jgi:hypothetical protein
MGLAGGRPASSYLLRPVLRDLGNVLAGCLADRLPQVERRCVAKRMLAEIVADTLEERLLADLRVEGACQRKVRADAQKAKRTDPAGNHREDRCALLVGDGVKDVVDPGRVLDRHLDRVACPPAVCRQRAPDLARDKSFARASLGEQHGRSKERAADGREALVEPELRAKGRQAGRSVTSSKEKPLDKNAPVPILRT